MFKVGLRKDDRLLIEQVVKLLSILVSKVEIITKDKKIVVNITLEDKGGSDA